MSRPFTKRGCEPCRIQHVKCDRRLPSCSECLRTGVECKREDDIRFKHLSDSSEGFEFSSAQPWAPTHGTLRFLDETPDLESVYRRDVRKANSPPVSPVPLPQSLPTSPQFTNVPSIEWHTPAQPASRRHADLDAQYPTSPYAQTLVVHSPETTLDRVQAENSWISTPTSSRAPHSTPGRADFRSRKRRISILDIYGPWHGSSNSIASPARSVTIASAWPLPAIEEDKLLWYYVENLSRSFDLVDPARHFRFEVPRRAVTCPTLLNAILALSARHLSRIREYDSLVADRYHQKCLEHLIPMLDDVAAIRDENLLLSAIILRHLEEIEAPMTQEHEVESKGESHLFGTHVLVTAHEDAATTGDVRQAAFWVGLRQEIYMAFINQHCMLPPLEHPNIDRSVEPAPDHVWSNRIVVLCADVLRYCFGEDAPAGTYNRLANSVNLWYTSKPDSFLPICYFKANETRALPYVWFLRDEIAVGWQHYYIAKILLGAHNPKLPRLGLRRAELAREIDADIKEAVLMLCGICQGNPAVSPNFTYAAMAIIVAGDKFVTLREQEALLHVLDTCETQHALATGHVVKALKAAWGWSSER